MKFVAISDVGCQRQNNEDMAYACPLFIRDDSAQGESSYFAVADGMGGYEGGEVASEITLRSFDKFVCGLPEDLSLDELIGKVKAWAVDANRSLIEVAASTPKLAEMGTTLTAMLFYGEHILALNVGDSRLYRFRNGILKQLSVDHSERERTGNPDTPSNLIYNFFGNNVDFFSDVTVLDGQVFPGDQFLLCSDGLSDMLDDETIENLLPDAPALVEAAKAAGGRDNITIILITIDQ